MELYVDLVVHVCTAGRSVSENRNSESILSQKGEKNLGHVYQPRWGFSFLSSLVSFSVSLFDYI